MNIEIGRVQDAPATHAADMSNYVCEHVAALMILGGIEAMSLQKIQSGFGERLHVTISHFKNAPADVQTTGMVVKDAIAKILSVANIMRIVIKPSEKELAKVEASWRKSGKPDEAKATPKKSQSKPKKSQSKRGHK